MAGARGNRVQVIRSATHVENARAHRRRCRCGRPGSATGKSEHQRRNHHPRDPVHHSPSRFLLRYPYAGLRLPRKLVESSRPQLLDHPQRGSGELDQRRDVNPLTCRGKRLEVCRPAGEHVDDAVIIAPLKVVEGHADLEDALIQSSYRASLGAPEYLECLVLLEVFSTIELLDPLQELRWRELVATGFR